MSSTIHTNGLKSPLQTEKATSTTSPRIVLAGKTGRILCVADIRGDYHELNRLIREHEATAVIHTGDFGFINADSLERMSDKILRHLLQYSPLIPPATRTQLLSIPQSAGRVALVNALNNSSIHFPLSQFPHLISGAITFPVPVFTVWGLIEDVRVLEKFRTGEYEVHNLNVLDEAASRVIEVSGLRVRLFGLGGAVAAHRMFDNGEGYSTIAGGQGTMWTTALQIGELIDTAQRVYDEAETRILIASAPMSKQGILLQLSNALKADITISAGLHFRHPACFNEFAVNSTFDTYRTKLSRARDEFAEVYSSVKERVDGSLNEQQQVLLKKAIEITQQIPAPETEGKPDGPFSNTWHWILTDAACGTVLLSITDGRISAEAKSTGLNFAHRVARTPAPPTAATATTTLPSQSARRGSVQEAAPPAKPLPTAPRAGVPPVATGMPSKPATATPPAPLNGIRGLATRPPQPPTKPSVAATPANGPTAPVLSSSTPAPATVLDKPSTQPRPTRVATSLAGHALVAAGVTKDKTPEAKPVADSATYGKPPAAVARPSAPPGKPPTASVSKPATPAPNGKASPAPARVPEKAAEPEKRPAVAAKKPSDTVKKLADVAEKSNGPTVNGVSNGETSSTSPLPENSDKGHSRDASTDVRASPPTKQKSLYVKGIPIPTTQDELKALFGPMDKASSITNVKIISDYISKKQKDYAYVDFATEEDMQEALKTNKGTIRETAVNVSISNPPSRGFPGDPRGRGRGSFRGRGGMRGGFASGAKKDGGEGVGGGEKGGLAAPAATATSGGGEK